MTRRSIVALGIGQCVNWGVLYYAFGALLIPLERDLSVPSWVIAGAFSTALLTSAAIAPAIGVWSDGGLGPRLLWRGGLVGATLLALWALVPGLAALYVIWAALGCCMAAALYEPAFVIVGRAVRDPDARLRALATVTVFGGLASALFLPLTTLLSETWGWRTAVAVLAGTLAVSTLVTCRIARSGTQAVGPVDTSIARHWAGDRRLQAMLVLFSIASLASAAFATAIVPALIARELAPMTAAMLGGLLGVMQIPGRALLMNGSLNASPSRLLIVSLLLQALGLATLVAARTPFPVGCGVALFALGAGLMTLIRPHAIQTIFGLERTGHLNGRVARSQQLARAAGPVVAVALAGVVGYGAVFGLLASVMAALALTWHLSVDV